MSRSFSLIFLAFACWLAAPLPAMAQDTLTLGEAYVNLSLTIEYFDSLDEHRLERILSFERKQLESLQGDIRSVYPDLYHLAWSQWHLIDTRLREQTGDPADRQTLLSWKNALEPSIRYYHKIDPDIRSNDFFKFIEFDFRDVYGQESNILSIKRRFTPLFNQNIYGDFKRIFYQAISLGRFHFDSLSYYSALFNIPFSTRIIENRYFGRADSYGESVSTVYRQASALDLIARYLQLDFLASERQEDVDPAMIYAAYEQFVRDLNPASNVFHYRMNDIIPKDSFFIRELNQRTCDQLYQRLREKYPISRDYNYYPDRGDASSAGPAFPEKYYFPTPAPYPTAKVAIRDFKPELKTLKSVDRHIRQSFIDAGYEGRLHYFYIREPGFAVATGIERINRDGSPAEEPGRWDLRQGGDEGFSLYQVFKAMFFQTQSDYRLIACVVAGDEIRTTSQPSVISDMTELLKKSYSTLPADLADVELIDKTITVLVYHYTQNEIGMVPMLNQNTILTVYDHLQNTPKLSQLTSL